MRIKLLLLPSDNLNPTTGEIECGPRIPPLGLAVLTSFLRHHHITVDQDDLDIKVIGQNDSGKMALDMSVFGDEMRVQQFIQQGRQEDLESVGEQLLNLTSTRGYDVIGLSIMKADIFSPAAVAMVLGKLIKERHDSKVIIGGTIHTEAVEKILASGFVDFRLVGDADNGFGEINLLDFCRAVEGGADLKQIRGVQYLKSGNLHDNGGQYTEAERYSITLPDFKGLPLDLYRRVQRIRVGDNLHLFRELVLPFFFIRGCPYGCAFCLNSQGERWVGKEPSVVAEELESLSRQYRTRYFLFHNSLINPTYDYANSLADELINRDLDLIWADCAALTQLDKPLIRKIKRAGAVKLVFGFESASPRILQYIRKPVSVRGAAARLKETYEAGIWTDINLICGFPYEREEDVELTISFLEKNQRHIMSCILNRFRLQGDFYHSPEKYGIRRRRVDNALQHNGSPFVFDEEAGLEGNERLMRTNQAYEQLDRTIKRLFVVSPGAPELYVYCKDPTIWNELKQRG